MRHSALTQPSSATTKTFLRWMPTFLGFPAGGLAAKLIVGPVDDIGAALAGGAITGAILGLAQWLGMRRNGPAPELWIVATSAGLAIGLGVGSSLVDFQTDATSLAVQGAICGAAIGVLQAVVLHRRLGAMVVAWPLLLAALWALGWTITSAAGVDVEAQYTVFGSSGAVVVTAGTAVLAIALERRRARLG